MPRTPVVTRQGRWAETARGVGWCDDRLADRPGSGFWLGAWAWDEVLAALRADGHEATAVTLPGLESVHADRSAITFTDHVEAICEAVRAAGRPVVLAVHSEAGFPGYAASDRIPGQIAAMVYVDTGPGVRPMDPHFEGVEHPLPSREELEEGENLEGLSEEQLETLRRAVPEPGGVIRAGVPLSDEARPRELARIIGEVAKARRAA